MRTIVFLLAFAIASAAAAVPLDVVTVGFPAVNCRFDTDCTITVNDFSGPIALPGAAGDGFLQSRQFPAGEPGTPAVGLHAYLYRIDLTHSAGILAVPCISQLRIPFGPVAPVDYDGDGNTDQVFVATSGGLGSVGLASAEQVGDQITFSFAPAVCAGSAPGNGETTFFFGLASTQTDRAVTAEAALTLGGTLSLDARAPQVPGAMFSLVPVGKLKLNGAWTLNVTGARPGARIGLYSGKVGRSPVPGCPGLSLGVAGAKLAFRAVADEKGTAVVRISLPARPRGRTVVLQAVDASSCQVSRPVSQKLE
jgi:hypothetical protein